MEALRSSQGAGSGALLALYARAAGCSLQLQHRRIAAPPGSCALPSASKPTRHRRRRHLPPAQGACCSAPATVDERAGHPPPHKADSTYPPATQPSHKAASAYPPATQPSPGMGSGYPAPPPYMPASYSQPLPPAPAAQHSGYWMPHANSFPQQQGYGAAHPGMCYPGMPPPVGALPPQGEHPASAAAAA